MSKLLDNECLSCANCKTTVKDLLFCHTLDDVESLKRCSSVVCVKCVHCADCLSFIDYNMRKVERMKNNPGLEDEPRYEDNLKNKYRVTSLK